VHVPSSVRDEHQHKHKVDGLVVILDEGAAVSLTGEPRMLKRRPAETRMVERRSAEPHMHGGGRRSTASRAWGNLEGCCAAVTRMVGRQLAETRMVVVERPLSVVD
jgi:hypothetical protein